MPSFRNDPAEWQRLDWRLLQNGFVHLFWSRGLLDETVSWLTQNGYGIRRVDASRWSSTDEALDGLAGALDFPDYSGRNFDALGDCMSDVACFIYGSDENNAGTAIVFDRFDSYAQRAHTDAQALLDILARSAKSGLLIGHRMLFLLQSDDPDIKFDRVGGADVLWNPAESLNAKRHPQP